MCSSGADRVRRSVCACVAAVVGTAFCGCAGPTESGGFRTDDVTPAAAIDEERPAMAAEAPSRRRSASERVRKNLPNILLYTQENEPVRFYDDLVKNKIVLIYFMFTTCQGICPATTANVVRMQDLLGDRFGRDIFFIAVTLTPDIDTPDVLKEYAEQYGAKPGWSFVTGDKDEIEMLRRKLGVYDPDPVIDADLYSHAGLLTFGNERTGRWAALPSLMPPKQIVDAMLRITREWPERGRGVQTR